MKELLTEEDYIKIIQLKENSKDIEYISSEWKNLDCVEGFMGDHFFLKINYKITNREKSENFFVKTKPTKTEIQVDLANKRNVYGKEIFFYNFLCKEFNSVGYSVDFAPKCYYCKNNETIVMEDLTQKYFKLFNRNDFFDEDHCKVALKSLAQYHANCICYEEKKSKELGKPYNVLEGRNDLSIEVFFILDDTDGPSAKFIEKTFDCYIEITKLMPVNDDWRKSFEERARKINLAEIFWQNIPSRKTLCHGDLWSNNMMFKYENGVPKECCLLDFQLIRHHHISFDAIVMIFTNTSRDFRKKHLYNLLDYYYETFESLVQQNGFKATDILMKDEFLKAAEALKVVACFQGASTRTITLLPKDVTSDIVNSGGNELEDFFFEDKRTWLILEVCKKDERFKNIIFDDIYDLNDYM